MIITMKDYFLEDHIMYFENAADALEYVKPLHDKGWIIWDILVF